MHFIQTFWLFSHNRTLHCPFPSCFEPHYESEAKCKVFVLKISFHSNANKTNFHMKSFALALLSYCGSQQLGNGLFKRPVACSRGSYRGERCAENCVMLE